MLCANSAGLDGANYGGHCDPDDRGTNRGQHSGDHRAAAPHHIKIERPLHSQPSRARGPLRRSNILLSNLEVYFENKVTSPVTVDAARDFLSETPKPPNGSVQGKPGCAPRGAENAPLRKPRAIFRNVDNQAFLSA